jgi:hypothetical protein
MDWVKHLSREIIMTALHDLKLYSPDDKDLWRRKLHRNAQTFLRGKWFEQLAEGAEIHPDRIRRYAKRLPICNN